MTAATATPKIPRSPEPVRAARMEPLAVLPVFFKLDGKRVVVAGGSEAAAWKIELLAATGADVVVYATEVCAEIEALATQPPAGSITVRREIWSPSALEGAAIAIGAFEDEHDAAQFAAAARAAGIPANVIDKPAFCAFQFGAIVNRSPLVLGISTDGAAPVFGQQVRGEIEALLPKGFKHWAQAAKSWRAEVKKLKLGIAGQRRFWERFTERAVAAPERAPTTGDFDELMAGTLDGIAHSAGLGSVTLVGAGPGDPELLTLRALRALRTADVILYDDLVTPGVLEYARREAKRIRVGKTGHGPSCRQGDINTLMVRLARDGQRIVRLKSGDPGIFGRAGEEIAELQSAGIPVRIVPGVSSAQAAAASLTLSLTHRDLARRLQFVTGHEQKGELPDDFDWSALADTRATTVVYMPKRTLPRLAGKLLAAGLPAATPACAIFNVSREHERVIHATIADLAEQIADPSHGALDGPCIVLIGEVLRTRQAGPATQVAPHGQARLRPSRTHEPV